MSFNHEVYEQSVERCERANTSLADALRRPDMLEKLGSDVPDTVEALNVQAHDREFVAREASRYLEACENYFDALEEPLSAEQRETFIQSIPLTPTELAQASYYMEHMTPEIARYHDALQAQGLDGAQSDEMMATIPRTFEDIKEMAQYYAEYSENAIKPYQGQLGFQDYKDDVNRVLPTLPSTPGVVAAQSFQTEQGLVDVDKTPEPSNKIDTDKISVPPSYDVIEEGKVQVGEELSAAFIRADEHNGADSLETIRMAQIAEADLVVVDAPEYAAPGVAS